MPYVTKFIPLADDELYRQPELLQKMVPYHPNYRTRRRTAEESRTRHPGSPWALGLLAPRRLNHQ